MQKKRNKKRRKHPKASIETPRTRWRQRRKVAVPSPMSITSPFDDDHDVERCASCQWRAENHPGAMVFDGDDVVPLVASTIPRVGVRITGGGPGFEVLARGLTVFVPDRAKLSGVLEVAFLEHPRLEVPWFDIELLVNGVTRSGEHRVVDGDEVTIRRFPDA